MSGSSQADRAAYTACRRLARRSRSSFYGSFFLLPAEKRRAMHALYAFMRCTDDLADNRLPPEQRRRALEQWRAALDDALAERRELRVEGRTARVESREAFSREPATSVLPGAASGLGPSTPNPQPSTQNSPRTTGHSELSTFDSQRSVLPAVADTVRRFQVPAEHLHAVIDGVRMDLDSRRYETFEQLAGYCHKVASAVGLACIHIWGFRRPLSEEAIHAARQCGVAMQLTNILRDLREDTQEGRVYLPLEDFCQCDYSLDDLAAGVADERFVRLVRWECERAQRLYHEAAGLFRWLGPDGRRVFGMMVSVYHRLLEKIDREPTALMRGRVRLNRWEKLRIAARWALLPPRGNALP